MPVKLLWYSFQHSVGKIMLDDNPNKPEGVEYFIYIVTIIVTFQ
jgi:hypothetical protein